MIDCYMRNLIHLVREIPEKIGWGILGAGLLTLVSCATMTEAQKTTMAGNALMVASQYSKTSKGARDAAAAGSLLTTYGQMQERSDLAKLGKPETNVTIINNLHDNEKEQEKEKEDNNSSNETSEKEEIRLINNAYMKAPLGRKIEIVNGLKKFKSESKDPQITLFVDAWLNQFAPPGFFMYKKWIDFNEDKAGNFGEYIGLNESSLDISDLDLLYFSFFGGRSKIYDGSYSFKIWNVDEGVLIDNGSDTYDGNFIRDMKVSSSRFYKIGKYKAVLNTANKETFTLDFEITGIKTPHYSPLGPSGFFVYNEWEDLNNDGKQDPNELSGLGKRVFNLDKESLRVGLNVPGKTGEVVFRSYTEKGELLAETINPYQRIVGNWTGPNVPPSSPPDFMDKIREHGPGKYRITASFKKNTSENYYINFEIIK